LIEAVGVVVPAHDEETLLPVIGFGRTSAIVAGVFLLGRLVTVTLVPEPKGISLEELTETRPGHADMTSAAKTRGATLPRSPVKP
jgi:hypothetical protein